MTNPPEAARSGDGVERDAVARIISLAKGAPETGQTSIGAWWWDARHDCAQPHHFEGECRDEDRKHAELMIPLLRDALPTVAESASQPEVERLREALEDILEHAATRIQDGIEMGATVWRLALEDCQRTARAALTASKGERG